MIIGFRVPSKLAISQGEPLDILSNLVTNKESEKGPNEDRDVYSYRKGILSVVNKIEKCVQSTPNFAQVVQFHKVRGSLPRGLHVSD